MERVPELISNINPVWLPLGTVFKDIEYGRSSLELNPGSCGAMTLTQYELEREERIRKNKAQMAALGLEKTVNELAKTQDLATIRGFRAARAAKNPVRRSNAKSPNTNRFVRRSVRYAFTINYLNFGMLKSNSHSDATLSITAQMF